MRAGGPLGVAGAAYAGRDGIVAPRPVSRKAAVIADIGDVS
jgi:hypothetical protein